MSDDILVSKEEQVGFIAFNRPALHNAISLRMWESIPRIMEQLQSEGAAVIVFTGVGQSFASGADLTELQAIDDEDGARALWGAIRGCLEFVHSSCLVTIAMIDGACIGGGCLLACACDFRFCSPSSSFAIPIARLGILLDDATIARIVACAGAPTARELLFTGGTIYGERAFSVGLVQRLVEPDLLQDSVLKTAKQVLANSPNTIAACKQSINRLGSNGAAQSMDSELQNASVIESYLSDEFKRRIGKAP